MEMYNGKLLGVTKCLLTENLNAEELDNLKEYRVGQFADGWGEGFEQREISTSDGNIYVHFWEYSNTYYIKTVPSQQKWTQKSFKKRNESQYFVNLLKPTAFIPRFA